MWLGEAQQSSGVQDRTSTKTAVEGKLLLFLYAKSCSSAVSHPSSWILILYKIHISQNHNYLLFPWEKLKEQAA